MAATAESATRRPVRAAAFADPPASRAPLAMIFDAAGTPFEKGLAFTREPRPGRTRPRLLLGNLHSLACIIVSGVVATDGWPKA